MKNALWVIPCAALLGQVAQSPQPLAPSLPGTVQGAGVHFAVTESSYRNVAVTSSQPIFLDLETAPGSVTMLVGAASGAVRTKLTVRNLAPKTTYYKYQNDYHSLAVLRSDARGTVEWSQDLIGPQFVMLQTKHSTKFLRDDAAGGDCTTIGTWAAGTKTCTLAVDVAETIQIDSDGITLDGNGHVVTTGGSVPPYGMVGVYLPPGRKNVTVQGLTVRNATHRGIFLLGAQNNIIKNNTVTGSQGGIALMESSSNTISFNQLSSNSTGISLSANGWWTACQLNTISDNTISGNNSGIAGSYFVNNQFLKNKISNNGPYNGIYIYVATAGNQFTDNILTSNRPYGAALHYVTSSTVFRGNTFSGHGTAVWIGNPPSVSGNEFYGNRFLGDTVFDKIGNNYFWKPLPVGGNYWSQYDTPAEGCNDFNSDGFCDAPYQFLNGEDRYPRTNVDDTPPVISPVVSPPANAAGWHRTNATVSWNVSDPESGISSQSGCGVTSITQETTGTSIACIATNGAGLTASATVLARMDETPPAISGLPANCTLWPPNQRMISLAPISADGSISGLTAFSLTVSSNEPASGVGPDWIVSGPPLGPFSVALRADRLGTGSGRVYTLQATATDVAGNNTLAVATCAVPHDLGKE